MMENNETLPLWNPRWILLTLSLPAVLLLLFWGKDLAIVSAEMTKNNWLAVLPVLGSAVLYGAIGTVLALVRKKQQKQTGLVESFVFLIAAVLIMILASCNIQRMHPDVEPFILPVHRWVYYIFTFLMPSAVYFSLTAASRLKGNKVMFSACAGILGIPLLIYFSFHLFDIASRASGNNHRIAQQIILILLPSLLIICGLAFILCLFRLLLYVIPWIRNHFPHARWGLPLVFALILPVSGLLLNRWIPFPCDLQHPLPYVLTVLNALILWVPLSGKRKPDLFLIGLKGAIYWFPLYFFVVFLPWIPLFIPGMFAVGAGFLILAPTFLFLLQNDFYYHDYRKCILSEKQIRIAFLTGFLLFPVLFFSNAVRDRYSLEYAVRTYYNTPYQMPLEQQKATFDSARLKGALDRYYNAKNGLELPFLSELYNVIAFRNLVVSDSQFLRMYSDLFGAQPSQDKVFFPAGRHHRFSPRPLAGLNTRKTSPGVAVSSFRPEVTADGAKLELILKSEQGFNQELVLKSEQGFNQEFAGTLTLPDGVFVKGLSLEINGKMERGCVAERKTALWIYNKITTVKRDPALIYYTGANQMRFFVFPVSSGSPRRVCVEFLYPEGVAPEIKLDDKICQLPSRGTPVAVQETPLKRTPEIILIIDRSETFGKYCPGPASVNSLFSLWKDAKTFRISSGITAADGISRSYQINEFPEAFREFQEKYQPGTPGFATENVIKGTILNYGELPENKTVYPVFVLWTVRPLYKGWNLSGFEEFAPEYPYLNVSNFVSEPEMYRFGDMEAVPFRADPHPAAILPDGRIVRAGSVIVPAAEDPAYSAAKGLKADSLKLLRDPSLEKELWVPLVRESIRSGVLIPQTSWIVLETEAQRRTLRKKQEQKLKSAAAFDIENTTEEIRADSPDTALMIIVLLGILCAGIYRNRPWIQQFFRSIRNG